MTDKEGFDDNSSIKCIHNVQCVNKGKKIKCALVINNKKVTYQFDTDASVSIIPENICMVRTKQMFL